MSSCGHPQQVGAGTARQTGYFILPIIGLFLLCMLQPLQAQEQKPVHVQEWEYYRAHPEEIQQNAAPLKSGKRPLDEAASLSKVVYGFHPYWISEATASGYYFSLLTHMAYFSADVDTSVSTTGGFMTTNSWNTALSVTHAQNAGIKVHLTVVMFANHSRVLNTAAYRTNLVNNILTQINNRNANGAVIDFESMSSSVNTNFKLFIKELGDTLTSHNKELAVCLPAVDWSSTFSASFFTTNNPVVSYYFLMAYDYYWRGSANAGPCAPLTTGTSIYHVMRSINSYLTAGASTGKLIAGFPYYGYDWPVVSSSRMAATSANASSITFSSAKTAAAAINDTNKFFDATYKTSWYRYLSGSQWRQVWYDDSLSLSMKYDSIKAKGIAGTGMWALSYDGSNTDLWGALKKAFASTIAASYSVFDDFESTTGHFTNTPTYSGSTIGISTSSSAARVVSTAKNGLGALKLNLIDNASSSSAWTVRFVSGGGSIGNNTAVDPDGYLGFWMKTATAASGAQVAVTVDDQAGGTELSPKLTVNNNGEWNYYEFNMKGSGWTSFASGSGAVNGTSATLDALMFYAPNASPEWVIYLDDVYYISTSALPVELAAFSCLTKDGFCTLQWETKTEVNTSHFVIERGEGDGIWTEVGSRAAAGNSNVPLQYRLTDHKLIGANTHYRLKSVDNDGTVAVCKIIKAENTGAGMYSLQQNFPNPFNPATIIRFTLPEAGFVRFSVFSVNGEEVYKSSSLGLASGYHEIPFNGANLAGGV
ncbi:MAG: hypothetical protein HYV28_20110, partial [Ignavibacteriales bacterium]|nr:hypothetical protein [Ignavibacteriales bacterium]